MTDRTPIIEVSGLTKRYGSTVAVDAIDLVIDEGEIFGILGPNGAGKTTTLEMIEGLRTPDAGTIVVAGIDAVRQPRAIKPMIGVQLQTTALFDYLTCQEIVRLFADLYGVDDPGRRVDEVLAIVGLQEKRRSQVSQLSGGQQQRLSIALGLVNRPRIAFLDEPTTGLDPAARRVLWQAIRDVRAGGTTVVLTTHYMEEAQILCDRVAIMDGGRIIALDTPQGLIRSLAAQATLEATVIDGRVQVGDLEQLPGVTVATLQHGEVALTTTDLQATLVAFLDLVARAGVALSDLRTSQATLEDVFLQLTGRRLRSEDAAGAENETVASEQPSNGRRRR